MMKRPLMVSVLATALALPAGAALAIDPGSAVQGAVQSQAQEQAQKKAQEQVQEQIRKKVAPQKEEPIYGTDLMTASERSDYTAKLKAAKTDKERDQIRWEHRGAMKERARTRGVTLPEETPAKTKSLPSLPSGGGIIPGGGGVVPGGGGLDTGGVKIPR